MERHVVVLVVVLGFVGFSAAAEIPATALSAPGESQELEDASSRRFTVLECYTCVNCSSVSSSTPKKICPRSLDLSKPPGCVTYVEKYHNMASNWVVRGCASERGHCKDIHKEHEQSVYKDVLRLVSCEDCVEDKCNSSHRSLVDWTIAILSLTLTPLCAKFVLS